MSYLEETSTFPVMANEVDTAESTSSTSFVDLTTPGPSVTVTTGETVLISFGCNILRTGVNAFGTGSFMAIYISGASTLGPLPNSGSVHWVSDRINYSGGVSFTGVISGLTPGSNIFTAKYKVDVGADTGTFSDRTIAVTPL